MARQTPDKRHWLHNPRGEYTTKSFTRAVWELKLEDQDSSNIIKGMRKGLAPHRAEIITWFALLGRMNTRDKLLRLKIIKIEEAECPIFKSEIESVNHLFTHCEFSWRIWTSIMRWWHIEIVLPKSQSNCSKFGWKRGEPVPKESAGSGIFRGYFFPLGPSKSGGT